MYDIYLFSGGNILPDLEDLIQKMPALADTDLHTRMLRDSHYRGFLGLDLPTETALSLTRRLRLAKALGYIIPSAYRQPYITKAQALPMAQQSIEKLQAERFPDDTFLGSVQFMREESYCWTFCPISERHTKVFAKIDKLDGHLWTRWMSLCIWKDSCFLGKIEGIAPSWAEEVWEELYKRYDIYLFAGGYILPDLSDLMQQAPILAHPDLQTRMRQRSLRPGLLELNLPLDLVVSLLERLRNEDAQGYIVPTAYRQAHVSREQAFLLAICLI